MATGIELATAYVTLTASTRGMVKDINAAFDRAEVEAKRSGKSVGQVMSDSIGSSLDSGLRSEMTQAGRRAGGRLSDSFEGSVDGRGASRRLTGQLESDADASGKKAGRRWAGSFENEASKANANMRSVGREGGEEAGGGFSDGFGIGVASIASKGGPFAAVIASFVAAAKVIGPQVEAAMQFEAGQDMVQARLGLDEASMAGIAKSASAAFNQNWGESIEANMDTAAVAIQAGLLKASDNGGAQAEMIGQLNAVSQILGEDIPSVVRAASQAIRTGIADDATGAFDLLVVAQQQGLNVSGDLLDTVNEYGTQFRKLGLSGPEAFGLISQAVKNGARDTDVAADALKEFSIRAIDNSESTRDAYTQLGLDADAMRAKFAAGGQSARDAFVQVTDAIRGIKDPADKANVAVALFGTQAEDLGGAMDSFDLSKAVQEFGNVERASQAAADKMTSNSANEWETAKRNIVGKIQEIRDALNMGDWFSDIPKAINAAFAPDAPPLTVGAPGVPWQPGNAMQGGNAAAGQNPLNVFAPTGFPGGGGGPGGPVGNMPKGLISSSSAQGSLTTSSVDGIASQFGLTKSSGLRPGDSGYHGSGQAGDYAGPPAAMQKFAAYMQQTYGSGLLELIYDAPGWGGNVKNGQVTGPFGNVYTMDQAGDHTDHVHVAVKTYDQGGIWPTDTLGINTTGKDEYVLTPEEIEELKRQGVDPSTMQHGMGQGAPPGPSPERLDELTRLPGQSGAELMGGSRTEGYIPAGAGSTAVAGESFMSSIYSMGAEVINGIIDQAASMASSAAGMAATAFAPGSGGAASGLTSAAIGMGTQAAKRGVEYGAQMLGIVTDSFIEQATPFGAPRILSTDPTAFMPQQALMDAATTSLEKAFQPQEPEGPQAPEPVTAGATAHVNELEPGTETGPQFVTNVNATVKDVNELNRTLNDQQRLNIMQYSGRP